MLSTHVHVISRVLGWSLLTHKSRSTCGGNNANLVLAVASLRALYVLNHAPLVVINCPSCGALVESQALGLPSRGRRVDMLIVLVAYWFLSPSAVIETRSKFESPLL